MSHLKNILFSFVLLFAGSLSATPATENGNIAPDNTGINQRDQRETELTADQQGMSNHDTELSRRIRQALMKDDSLSVNAHNVKIITTNGKVTLKGPVNSMREKREIHKIARNIAGSGFVIDEVDVIKGE